MIRTLAAANRLAMRFLRSWAALALLMLSCASVPASAQFARFSVKPVNCPQGLIFADGCVNNAFAAGVNNAVVPGFFGKYAAQTATAQAAAIAAGTISARLPIVMRPIWNLPGIDYRVGIPGDTVLKDPVAHPELLPAGCSLNANNGTADGSYSVGCNGSINGSGAGGGSNRAVSVYTPLVFDGWDFGVHGGLRLNVGNWKGSVRVSNSKITATVQNAYSAGGGWFVFGNTAMADGSAGDCLANATAPCVVIDHDYVDVPYGPTLSTATTMAVAEGFSASYNYVANTNVRFISSGSSHRPTLEDYCTLTNNFFAGMINPNYPSSVHGELTLTTGPCGHSLYAYNTFFEPANSGGFTPNGKGGNGYDVSGWIFPFAGPVLSPTCSGATSTGNTVSIPANGCTASDGQLQRTPIGSGVTLQVTDGSGNVVNGSVTAINGQDFKAFGGLNRGVANTFTMSQTNELPTAFSFKVVVRAPQFDVHHNAFINNMWNAGYTVFGAMIGGLTPLTFDEITVQDNWIDPTGTFLCFATDMTAAIAGSTVQNVAGNYNLLTGGKITDFSSSNASGCVGRYPGSASSPF